MQPRYLDGTRVRIRTRSGTGQIVYHGFEEYENMTGVVLNSKAVVAYVFHLMNILEQSYTDPLTTIYMNAVRLEEGITLDQLSEYFLEEV